MTVYIIVIVELSLDRVVIKSGTESEARSMARNERQARLAKIQQPSLPGKRVPKIFLAQRSAVR